MVAMGVVAAATQAVDPSTGALTAANNLRIVSIAILGYEYVARTVMLTLLLTHTRPVISSHFPSSTSYTRQQGDVGKKDGARM